MTCPFCQPDEDRIFYDADPSFFCLWDGFPLNPGHALVVPRKHIGTWFDASYQDQVRLLEGIQIAKQEIEKRHQPDGFNIGINIGAAAGQTVPHLHVHVIPRYKGDVADPRGGVRYVIPEKANYLEIREERAVYEVAPQAVGESQSLYGSEVLPLLDSLLQDLSRADSVDLAVAFILESGLTRIESHLLDVLERGGRVRILTGDYMDVTEPRALLRLLDLQAAIQNPDDPLQNSGLLECRVFETDHSLGFHPKAYLIGRDEGDNIAYVGSSNLTRSALERGVEWNSRLTGRSEPGAVLAIEQEFERLFSYSRVALLTEEWIESYRKRRRSFSRSTEPVEIDAGAEKPEPPPEPHRIQQEALTALDDTRREGNRAGLVVLATGMGKTWLSAFDSVKFKRVLFVAHREEILRQARSTFRRIRPEASFGLYTGTEKLPDSDVLFASVQTLGRASHLDRFAEDAFDYIIVDEFHHAAASTYRRLIDHFEPEFLLGLTATPERTDGADLLWLCGENLVYRCDLADGINQDLLSPFQYFGVPDDIDFSNIPWRSGRFDPEQLENEVITKKRAQNAYEQWDQRGGERTLAFCVSQRHADYMAEFYRGQGVAAVAVHAGPTAAPRTESLHQLETGDLKVVFSVDMFNEGVDVPHVDTVIMLRPTESRILWLQQFGRGLRRADGKSHLRVIDYIGNHRTFLQVPMLLLAGGGESPGELLMALERLDRGELELPKGCEVTYDVEALNILKALAQPTRGADEMMVWYRSFRERHGVRPTASEAWHAGYDPKLFRTNFGSWLSFVNSEGDLTETEQEAFLFIRDFLESLEITPMTKSYKILVLLSMLSRGAFPGALSATELAAGVQHFANRSILLAEDVGEVLGDQSALIKLLEENPVAAWVDGRGMGNKSYFSYQEKVFASLFGEPEEHREAIATLTREICDLRLVKYLERLQGDKHFAPRLVCRVSHNNNNPILFLPERKTTPGIPDGWHPVTANGSEYSANFVKLAINGMKEAGSEDNCLPAVLKDWFGTNAGQPGTPQRVILEWHDEMYLMRPVGDESAGPELWYEYMRADIPPLWGMEFSKARWERGYVKIDQHIFLLVTLEKKGMQQAHQYDDRFLSPTEFQWVSQNQQSQKRPSGQIIKNHEQEGMQVHLFVRKKGKTPNNKAMAFIYCGDVTFIDWEGSEPITIRWQLKDQVPDHLRQSFGIG
jgi:superfamily II DNA or RNA helicase/diadenosine tetraphosphate (Ap4A) HIT family hydrolase/HKD family nuclease